VRRRHVGLAQKRAIGVRMAIPGRGEVKNAEAGDSTGLLYPAIFVFRQPLRDDYS